MPAIRLVTFNIRHGCGIDGKTDLARVEGLIKEIAPDVVCLQEVDKYRLRSRLAHQTKRLAKGLGYFGAYGQNTGWLVGGYGNAILSRFPIIASRNLMLKSRVENRGLLRVVLETGGYGCGRFVVFNTHLGLRSSERIQHITQVLVPGISLETLPVILCGDFNAWDNAEEIKRLTLVLNDAHVLAGCGSGYTYPSTKPKSRIDYIFLSRHWKVNRCDTIATPVSDHLPVFAEMNLRGDIIKDQVGSVNGVTIEKGKGSDIIQASQVKCFLRSPGQSQTVCCSDTPFPCRACEMTVCLHLQEMKGMPLRFCMKRQGPFRYRRFLYRTRKTVSLRAHCKLDEWVDAVKVFVHISFKVGHQGEDFRYRKLLCKLQQT